MVLPGVDVELDQPAKQPPQRFKHSAVQVGVVFRFQQLDQRRDAQRHANPLLSVPAEVGRDVVEAGVIGNHHHLAQCTERINAGQKIGMLNLLTRRRQVAQRHLHQNHRLLAGHVGFAPHLRQ